MMEYPCGAVGWGELLCKVGRCIIPVKMGRTNKKLFIKRKKKSEDFSFSVRAWAKETPFRFLRQFSMHHNFAFLVWTLDYAGLENNLVRPESA